MIVGWILYPIIIVGYYNLYPVAMDIDKESIGPPK
jgi:hypothetical protein